MTTLTEILRREQALYLATLEQGLKNEREEHEDAVAELLISINTEELHGVYRLIRPDIIFRTNGAPEIVRVVKDKYFDFDPIEIRSDSSPSIHIAPFHWDKIELQVSGQIESWDPFIAWAETHLDVEDSRADPEIDFMGVIHSVSTPTLTDQGWRTEIDFGSAEIDAFTDLIDTIISMNAERIGITSHIEDPA